MKSRFVRAGAFQALGAVVLAALSVGIIAAVSWEEADVGDRLAIAGVVLFVFALIIGSPRLVGAASLPVLGSALIASAASDETQWLPSMLVGLLWYVAVELAWDAIVRRGGADHSARLSRRRIHEVSMVVMISLFVASLGYAATSFAPDRTLVVLAPLLVAIIAGLGWSTRHLVSTAPTNEHAG
jgi:hypothetical protein